MNYALCRLLFLSLQLLSGGWLKKRGRISSSDPGYSVDFWCSFIECTSKAFKQSSSIPPTAAFYGPRAQERCAQPWFRKQWAYNTSSHWLQAKTDDNFIVQSFTSLPFNQMVMKLLILWCNPVKKKEKKSKTKARISHSHSQRLTEKLQAQSGQLQLCC